MAKITIGGVEYLIPELNFIALERVWPFVEDAMNTLDPMKGPSAGVAIIAAGLMESDDYDRTKFGITIEENLNEDQVFARMQHFLKKRLKATEIGHVISTIYDVLREAGVLSDEEDPQQPLETGDPAANPSTETAPGSLPSSLQQDVKAEAGTA